MPRKGKVRDQREDELNDIRTVLNIAAGKRLFFRMFEKCRVHQTFVHESPIMMGFQD